MESLPVLKTRGLPEDDSILKFENAKYAKPRRLHGKPQTTQLETIHVTAADELFLH
jgi:hypothetical protein